jgi:hypothetical protein
MAACRAVARRPQALAATHNRIGDSSRSGVLKTLLDENFPLALYRSLKADGEDVAHLITPGWCGTPVRTGP